MAVKTGPEYSSELASALGSGRVVLLMGQRHTPGLVESLVRDMQAALDSEVSGAASLPEIFSQLGSHEVLNRIRPVFSEIDVSIELTREAENPWAMVITSAVDPSPLMAFQKSSGPSRRLHVVDAGQISSIGRSSPTNAIILRLFGSVDEIDERLSPPTNPRELTKRSTLVVAPLIAELPRLIGPGGRLVVTGVGTDDWLSLEQLSLALDPMGPGTVHWFATDGHDVASDQLNDLFGDRLIHWQEPFVAFLDLIAGNPDGRALAKARTDLVSPGDRIISLKTQSGEPKRLTIRASEWRNVARVGALLDDDVLANPPPVSPDERTRLFREHLRSAQRVPDWEGVARGYLFRRDAAASLVDLVEREMLRSLSIHATSNAKDGPARARTSRLPIIIQGSPATGKTRLLHWVAFDLRRRGHSVLYLYTNSGRIHNESVARACQMLETKGAEVTAVIADSLDMPDYRQLNEFLASVGRNTVLIGSLSKAGEPTAPQDVPSDTDDYRVVHLDSHLSLEEAATFREYLSAHGVDSSALPTELLTERYFLLLLYRLLPESRTNIHGILAVEYERLLRRLDTIVEAADGPPTTLAMQLEEIRMALFPGAASDDRQEESSFLHNDDARKAVHLALFCAQIDRPIPLDLLIKSAGPGFLSRYSEFIAALETNSILQEVSLDAEGTLAIAAEHSFLAELVLRNILPNRSDQVSLLDQLISVVAWSEDAYPGENPDQDYAVEVLKAIGPRGVAESLFGATAAIESLVTLLSKIRERHGVRLPTLLLLEANSLRLLADRRRADADLRIQRCDEAAEILQQAEEILSRRRPSPARNGELMNVFTTLAATYGYLANALMDKYEQEGGEELRHTMFHAVDLAQHYSTRSRTLGPSSYYPIDVAFWANRDVLTRLNDLSEEERATLLAKLESILDMADEEPIEQSQVQQYQQREIQLLELQQDFVASETLAQTMLAKGNFAGVVLIARGRVLNPHTGALVSREAGIETLAQFEDLGPGVFSSEDATRLMHRLWMEVNLGTTHLGGEEPVIPDVPLREWIRWQRILESRLLLAGNEDSPYLHFCLAWALLQQEDYRRGLEILRATEPLTIGNRRRVGALVVVADEDGIPKDFTAIVRRRDQSATIAYSPELQSEVFFPRSFAFEGGMDPQINETVTFYLGANYRGVTPWRRTSGTNSKK